MLGRSSLLYLFALCLVAVSAQEEKRALPIFNVVSFPNDVCDSDDSRNGTCYTSEECSNKGGKSSGTCAEGFGICCVFNLDCGDTSSENNTYLVKDAFTTGTTECMYKICKCTDDICRIRFDFTTNVLAGPISAPTVTLATASTNAVTSIGNCATDQMTVTGAGASVPVICGTNSGYHLIVDATEDCTMLNFAIGGSQTTSRSWDVFVSQYKCGELDDTRGGPPGCLQYHTSETGTIESFNFPTATTVTSTATHLANQKYSICVKRQNNKCAICYAPEPPANPENADNQGSFGVSISAIANMFTAGTDSLCTSDYVFIPAAVISTISTLGAVSIAQDNYFCGRSFGTAAATAHATMCSGQVPFTVGVNFNDVEMGAAAGANMANMNEISGAPGGIIGFRLHYTQTNCA